MKDCGDQAAASIHDVSLPPVHIGAIQCPIDLPWYIRLIILGVDGCLRSYTVHLDMPLWKFHCARWSVLYQDTVNIHVVS